MKHLILIAILALAGCATVPYSSSAPSVMDVQTATYEIVTGNTKTSTGFDAPIDLQTQLVIAQLKTISYDDLKNMPPQRNPHSQALVQAAINLKSEAAADSAWKHNWCAQAGQRLTCLDSF